MKSVLHLSLFALCAVAWTVPSVAQSASKPKLGVSLEEQGIAIDYVAEASQSAMIGFKSGDFLLTWNGDGMGTVDDVVRKRDAVKGGEKVTFTVRRGSQVKTIQYQWPKVIKPSGLELGMTAGSGLCVTSVFENTPAQAAGVKPGDILVAFGRDTLEKYDDLIRALGRVKPGSVYRLKIRRGANEKTLRVPFAQRSAFSFGDQPSSFKLEDLKRQLEGLSGGDLSLDKLPFDMKQLEKMNIPGMGFVKELMGLTSVTQELDQSIAELEKLNNPALSKTIARLKASRKKIADATRSMANMRSMANNFMGEFMPFEVPGFELEDFAEPEELIEEEMPEAEELVEDPLIQVRPFGKKKGKVSKKSIDQRIQELVESGVVDAEELNKIIQREFPNIKVEIVTTDEKGTFDAPSSRPTLRKSRAAKRPATSRPAPKSRPASRPTQGVK